MGIFEFAMQMELDGEKFYREIAEKSMNQGLKKIFSSLADDEVEHYRVFKNINDHSSLNLKTSTILADSKNVFAAMKQAGDINLGDEPDQKSAYQTALEMERKSYLFYEEKTAQTDDPREKRLLQAIAREERHHYRLLEGVLDFVAQPENWLENAEFVHLTDY